MASSASVLLHVRCLETVSCSKARMLLLSPRPAGEKKQWPPEAVETEVNQNTEMNKAVAISPHTIPHPEFQRHPKLFHASHNMSWYCYWQAKYEERLARVIDVS